MKKGLCTLGSLHFFKADGSRNLSQDKNKVAIVKVEQIYKRTIIFTQHGQKLSF